MSSVSRHRAGEEKLGVILGEIASVRTRINSLAWQAGLFPAAAILIGAAALALIAALALSAGGFLAILIVLAIAVPVGLFCAALTIHREHLDAQRAAEVADERGGLKGRLAAVAAFARIRRRPALWPYLIEDTLDRRADFAPRRIEPRLVSSMIWALVAACAFAAVTVPIALAHRRAQVLASAAAARHDLTLNLRDLQLRPARPGERSDFAVSADASTMLRLRERMAEQGGMAAGSGSAAAGASTSSLFHQATSLAARLQSALTGRDANPIRLRLKLADAAPTPSGSATLPQAGPEDSKPLSDYQFEHHQSLDGGPHIPIDPRHYGQRAQQAPAVAPPSAPSSAAQARAATGASSGAKNPRAAARATGVSGGASHGIGVSPDNLFGPPMTLALGGEGFAISIQARQADRSKGDAGQTWVPPRISVPLNSTQLPDEPVARATVPARDRAAVERVFER